MALPDVSQIEPVNVAHINELRDQVAGDGSLYNRLFTIFEEEGPELVSQLRELLPKGVHQDIHEVIHKVKGSSAAMGATRIHTLAAAGVEICRAESDLSELDGIADQLESEYALYLREAKRFLD